MDEHCRDVDSFAWTMNFNENMHHEQLLAEITSHHVDMLTSVPANVEAGRCLTPLTSICPVYKNANPSVDERRALKCIEYFVSKEIRANNFFDNRIYEEKHPLTILNNS
jgi:hypothetical protein